MKIILFILLLSLVDQITFSQNITDSGTYLIHKFEQNIGKEKYTATKDGNNILYDVDFKYIDRG